MMVVMISKTHSAGWMALGWAMGTSLDSTFIEFNSPASHPSIRSTKVLVGALWFNNVHMTTCMRLAHCLLVVVVGGCDREIVLIQLTGNLNQTIYTRNIWHEVVFHHHRQ